MRKLEWHQWLLVALFLVAVFFTGLFGFRAIRRAIYWHNHRDEPIRAWMNGEGSLWPRHGSKLWLLVSLELWLRSFVD